MKNETFSIVMPAYNAEKTLEKSVDSVLNQDYHDFKLYIVNDHSTDNTEQLIRGFRDKRIVALQNAGDPGVANARNVALDCLCGNYVAFLDSDDLWLPNKLSRQLSALRAGYDLVFSFYHTFRHSPEKLCHRRTSPMIVNRDYLLKTNYIGNLTGVYNAKKIGVVRQKNIGHEDYLMWLDVIKKTKIGYCVPEYLALYRLSAGSLSANKLRAAGWQWRIYRRELAFSAIKSSWYFIHYAQKAIARRWINRHS